MGGGPRLITYEFVGRWLALPAACHEFVGGWWELPAAGDAPAGFGPRSGGPSGRGGRLAERHFWPLPTGRTAFDAESARPGGSAG